MKALLPAALLLAAAPAAAGLFGRGAEERSAAALADMRASYAAGDCVRVLSASDLFFSEKPSAGLREEAYGYMGRCYEREGLPDKAISLYKLAIGLYPDDGLFAFRLASIYNASGFHENAVPLFRKVLAGKPDDIGAGLGLARAYAALGFYGRAKNYYSRVVVLQDFSDAAVLKEYAACMLKKRDWGEALFIAGKGSEAAPASSYWKLAEARVAAGKGDYYKAIAASEAAIKLEPSRRLRLERALYLLLAGLPRRAMEAADAELAAAPGDPLASEVKGMALRLLGRPAEAEPYFRAALKGGPFTAGIAGAFLAPKAAPKEGACSK